MLQPSPNTGEKQVSLAPDGQVRRVLLRTSVSLPVPLSHCITSVPEPRIVLLRRLPNRTVRRLFQQETAPEHTGEADQAKPQKGHLQEHEQESVWETSAQCLIAHPKRHIPQSGKERAHQTQGPQPPVPPCRSRCQWSQEPGQPSP